MPFTQGQTQRTIGMSPGDGGMFVECQLIEAEELFDRQKVGAKHGDSNAFIEPGMMWFLRDIWDHQCPDAEQYLPGLIADARTRTGNNSLSVHYLTMWATRRDPLCLMLPCNNLLYPDSAPAGSNGWKVTGAFPAISLDRMVKMGKTHRYLIRDGRITLEGYSHA